MPVTRQHEKLVRVVRLTTFVERVRVVARPRCGRKAMHARLSTRRGIPVCALPMGPREGCSGEDVMMNAERPR